MHSSSRHRKCILERSSVDQPFEVGNEFGAYNCFPLPRSRRPLGAAVDGGNHFVENILEPRLEAAACIGSKGGDVPSKLVTLHRLRPQAQSAQAAKSLLKTGDAYLR